MSSCNLKPGAVGVAKDSVYACKHFVWVVERRPSLAGMVEAAQRDAVQVPKPCRFKFCEGIVTYRQVAGLGWWRTKRVKQQVYAYECHDGFLSKTHTVTGKCAPLSAPSSVS